MTLRDLLDLWTAYSHRKNLERGYGLRIEDPAAAAELVATLYRLRRSGDRAAASAMLTLLGAGVEPPPDKNTLDRLVLTCHDSITSLSLYSYGFQGGRRWRGLTRARRISDPIPTPNEARFDPAMTTTIEAFFNAVLAPYGVAEVHMGREMPAALDAYVAWNARNTESLNVDRKLDEAQELAKVCRKVGCQRRGASALFRAYGKPDPEPYIESSHRVSFSPTPGHVVKLRHAVPSFPAGSIVLIAAPTPENDGKWRVTDDALRLLNSKIDGVASSFQYCEPDEARSFLDRLVANLTNLFTPAPAAAASSTPVPAESAESAVAA